MIQANINNRWAQLSQGEKAELLGIYTRAGYNDLASIIADYNEFSSGGGIHIKPENRGKFTALKERTGHSASWFKEHGTPAQKKMAVFALNARKWNHADGGYLFGGGGKTVRETWEERTGKSWSEVGDYYDAYDKTTKGNIALLKRLNAGEFDYLANPEPIEPERRGLNFDINFDALKEGFTNTVSNVGDAAKNLYLTSREKLIDSTDILNRIAYNQDWRNTDAGEFVYNGKTINSDLDFSQRAAPEDKKRVYGSHINPKRITEWDDYKCASFLTNWRLHNGGNSQSNYDFVRDYNYRGDAWTWLKNAQDVADKGKDVSVDYNMYTENKFTGKESKEEVIRRTRQLASTRDYKERILASIRPGSVVTLLYPNSKMFENASKDFRSGKGTTMSTHIGDVVELDGKLYVRDNVGGAKTNYKGRIHYRPLDEVINGRDGDGVLITGIANYGKTNVMGTYYDTSQFGMVAADGTTPLRVQSDVAYRMMDAIDRNKDVLVKKYGIPESLFRQWMQLSLGLGTLETYMQQGELAKQENGIYGPSRYLRSRLGIDDNTGQYQTSKDAEYAKKAFLSPFKQPAEWISGLFAPNDGSKARKWAESKGVTNIKYRGDRGDGKPLFTEKELEELGLKDHMYDERIMESPEVSGVMSMIAIKKKYDEIKDIMKDMPDELKNDRKLIGGLLFLSWNQGTRNIRATADRIKKGGNPNDMYKYMEASYTAGVDYFFRRFVDTFSAFEKNAPTNDELNKMSKDEVRELQENLVRLGYLERSINGIEQIDGIVGKNTRRALEKFREAKGQEEKAKENRKEQSKKKEEPKRTYTQIDKNSYEEGKNRRRGWGVLAVGVMKDGGKLQQYADFSGFF